MDPLVNTQDGIGRSTTEPSGPKPWLAWSVLVAIIVALISVSIARSVWRYDDPNVAEFDRGQQGQFDFHNGIYFPSRAYLDGQSPYGKSFSDNYPVTRSLPLMSPLVLLIHAPIAALPVRLAEVLYFVINGGLMAMLGWYCVKWMPRSDARTTWLLIAWLLIAASRAGHTTLFTGYLTALMVVGSLVALDHARSRPWLSALGVMIASCKPTYAIPLFLLMVARGDRVAALRGLGLSIVGASVALGRLLLVTTPQQLWLDLQQGQAAHMADAYEFPVNTWTRIDVLALIAKWLEANPGEAIHLIVMVLLLPLPALALWRLQFIKHEQSAAGLSSGLIAVSMLATLYHHVYDALLLFPAAFGLILCEPSTQRGSPRLRLVIALLLLLVACNYPSSEMFLNLAPINETQHRMLTSTGPIAMTAAWLGMCALPWLPKDVRRSTSSHADKKIG